MAFIFGGGLSIGEPDTEAVLCDFTIDSQRRKTYPTGPFLRGRSPARLFVLETLSVPAPDDEWMMKTYVAKPGDIERNWFVIDGEGLVLGRVAVMIANRLRGKHKPMYTPFMDCGDHIVVVNADKIELTGNKKRDKRYYRHTGYPGGIKETSPEKILAGKRPEQMLELAVTRMVPRGPLGRQMLRKLHIYRGPEHPHQAQSPQELDFKSLNTKNSIAGVA